MTAPRHHDENLRSDLIKAATSRLASGGPRAVSLREIAKDCTTSTTAIYTLFGGKNELIAAAVVAAFEDLGATLQQAITGESALDRLVSVAQAYREWALGNTEVFTAMFAPAPQNTSPRSQRLMAQFAPKNPLLPASHPLMGAMLTQGEALESTMGLADSVLSLLREVANELNPERPLSEEQLVIACQVMWAGAHGSIQLESNGFISPIDFKTHAQAVIRTALGCAAER